MVGFRYHLVSIVAVFLALGIGILLGSTVVEQELIDQLRDQIRSANADVDRAQDERGELRDELRSLRGRYEDLLEQSGPQLVEGRLVGVPVIVLSVRGVDERPVDELHALLAGAGARHEGTIWFTDRLRLRDQADLEELGEVLARHLAGTQAARAALASQLAAELLRSRAVPGPAAGATPDVGTEPTLLARLVAAGFADYEPQASGSVDQNQLPLAGSRFAVVSGPDADVPNDHLLYPLLRAMTSEGVAPVVAAEAVAEPEESEEGEEPASFVAGLRGDDQLSSRLSSVDNLGDVAGQAATVLALQGVAAGVVGHFGVADGAQRLLPAPSQ